MICQTNRPFVFARVKAIYVVGCFILILTGCGDPVLWEPVESTDELLPTPQAIRSETVEFDVEKLRPPSNKRIRLTLPGRGEVIAEIAPSGGFKEVRDGQFIWRGTIENEAGSQVRFSVVGRILVGSIITADGRMYAIRSVRDGIALIEELDATRFPKEEATEPPPGGTGPSQPVSLSVDSNPPLAEVVTDPATGRIEMITAAAPAPAPTETTNAHVLLLYTSAAKTYLANQEGVTASINLLISDADRALGESGVPQDLRLAYEWATTYKETGDPYQDWLALKRSAEIPALKPLAQMRIDHSADIVVLLTKDTSDGTKTSCGQADQMKDLHNAKCDSVFAAVPVNCAINMHSFAHELGHVMGARHSQGFIAKSNAWHTLMASPNDACKWPNCPRIPHWSNPNVLFQKGSLPPESTGSDTANNSSLLNDGREAVSGISDNCD